MVIGTSASHQAALKAGWMYLLVGGRKFFFSHPSNLLCMKVRHFRKVDCIVFTILAKILRSEVGGWWACMRCGLQVINMMTGCMLSCGFVETFRHATTPT